VWSIPFGRVAKWFPHVHHRQFDFFGAFFAEKRKELIHACFAAVLAAEPDSASLFQVAHDNAIDMPLLDRDLVDTDDSRRWFASFLELGFHVAFVQLLDRVPVEHVLFGDILNRLIATFGADHVSEPLGTEGAVEQPLEPFAPHRTAFAAVDTSDIQLQINPIVAAG
jgi:hypothetical protein